MGPLPVLPPPGAVFGSRWRRCRVHATANLWLHHSTEVLETLLLPLLAPGLGLPASAPPADRSLLRSGDST